MALTVFFDSDCPFCRREVAWLRKIDRQGALRFVDAQAAEFDAASWGFDQVALMSKLHVLGDDGRLYTGADGFRAMYRALGLGWLVAPTAWPGLRQLTDAAYRSFARNRLRWGKRLGRSCDTGTCAID